MNILRKYSSNEIDMDEKIMCFQTNIGFAVKYIKAWSLNRETDEVRVKEILDHMTNKGWVPSILYVADIPAEGGIVCYDGNHRLQAYKLGSPAFNSRPILVMFLKNYRDIRATFNAINKSVPVAAINLLLDVDSQKISKDLDRLTKNFMKRFPAFVSTSDKCHVPKFNKDHLKNQLYDYMINTNVSVGVSVEKLKEALELLNTTYQTRNDTPLTAGMYIRNKVSQKALTKCENGNLWLFAMSRTINTEHIDWAVCQVTKHADLMLMD